MVHYITELNEKGRSVIALGDFAVPHMTSLPIVSEKPIAGDNSSQYLKVLHRWTQWNFPPEGLEAIANTDDSKSCNFMKNALIHWG